MTHEEFEFWEKVFLIGLARDEWYNAKIHADQALTEWKVMRKQIQDKKDGPYR